MKIAITTLELEVLRKAASGETVQQIASDLNLSPKAVVKHQKEILGRTSTSNLMHAMQELARRGFEIQAPEKTLKV